MSGSLANHRPDLSSGTMTPPTAVVAEARAWLGTPFRHQGRRKGEGVDCIGLVVGVGAALGLIDLAGRSDEERRRLATYRRTPNGFALRRGCDAVLDRIALRAAGAGDVLLFAGHRLPQHLGIVSDRGGAAGLIHCNAEVGRCVEHRLDESWRARIVQAYRFKGVA